MIKYSDNARAVLDTAGELAVRTGGLICTEHILYGLLSVDGSAKRILNQCGLYEDDVLKIFSPMPLRPRVEMSARAGRAVESARDVATRLGSSCVGTELAAPFLDTVTAPTAAAYFALITMSPPDSIYSRVRAAVKASPAAVVSTSLSGLYDGIML